MTITLDPSQLLAVRLMVTAKLACVTGGAGTGKTTCLRYALDEMDALGQTYALAAPTGKAAKRMTETTDRPARTIHRLLGWQGGFTVNQHNPLQVSAVIIDEASMLDVELAAAVFAAVDPARTRLIFMGDANQLAPVGPGYLFGDMIASERVPVARLTTLHRAAELSWINTAAQAILRREMPDITTQRADFRFVHVEESAQVMPVITELTSKIIPREIDEDAQVLIPQKPGVSGIHEANVALQNALNPVRAGESVFKRGKDSSGGELRIQDRVIQTRNNYDLNVFNGEIGTLHDIEDGKVLVQFPDRELPVTYNRAQAGALQLAYALTVHKMQGSEFPWIVFVCHSTHTHMLSPQLMYTAITRGKRGVILVGNEQGLRNGLRQDNPPRRNSGLVARLNHDEAFA